MGKSLLGEELGKGYHQRKDGRYEARIQIKGQTIDLINSSLSKLRKEFEAAKKELNNKKTITLETKENPTLAEWYQKWFMELKAPQLKNDTCRRTMDRNGRNTYVAVLGEKKIKSIVQGDIQTATYELFERGLSEKYIREGLGMLKACLEIAFVNHMIDVNPCVCVLFPNSNEYHCKEMRVLDNWELELFLKVCENTYYDEMYQIMISSGMRIGEVGGLQWECVDFTNQVIRIRRALMTDYYNGKKVQQLITPKTSNSYREIPFFGETADLFRQWKIKQDERKKAMGDRWRCDPEFGDLVFTTIYGSPVNKYVVQQDLNKIVKNMTLLEKLNSDREHRLPRDIKHIHPHALRHTACSILFMKGMDPVVIQRIMGHANFSTTLGYMHLLENKRKKEIGKVGNFFDDLNGGDN